MEDILQTKILYDDRHSTYFNHFTETKIVHQPLLRDYLKEIIPEDDSLIHVVVHDSKNDEGVSYLSEVKDLLNSPNVVPHIISPRSYYSFPDCKAVHYHLALGEGMTKRLEKMYKLVELEEDNEKIIINVTQDINAIMLEYKTPSGQTL